MVDWLPPLSDRQKKNIVMLAAAFLVGVLLLAGGALLQPRSAKQAGSSTGTSGSELALLEQSLSKQAQEILSSMSGVGRVMVRVSLASGPEVEYARNQTSSERQIEEKADSGTTRKTTEGNQNVQLAVARSTAAGDTPVIVKTKPAEVSGVLVVAEGAEDPGVRARLYEACSVLFGVSSDRISVQPMKKGGR
ncbi:MAG: hypothetical protein ACPLPR_03840 [Bacillota bacterium]